MRFRLHADIGRHIRGWVVPDNPHAISRVHVYVEGRRVADIPATLIGDNLLNLGWHSTGQCIFAISHKEIPGVAEIERLDVYDAETNVLVYRRTPMEGRLAKRVMLVSSSIYPETALQTSLYSHFRQCYFDIGDYPEEILTSIFNSDTLDSGLFSGRILLHRYEDNFVASKTTVMLLIHDPFVEMANRLIWLRERADLADDPKQRWRLGEYLEAALFVRDYDLTDPKSLKRLFRMLPEPAYHLLYNPLTRQLSIRNPEERVWPRSSITAVETLSRVAVVGHSDYFQAFVMTVYDRLGIEAPMPMPAPRLVSEEVLALAAQLRGLRIAREMVNFDSVITDAVRKSVAKSWDA